MRDRAVATEVEQIREIDTTIGGPHMGGNIRNARQSYAREAKDPHMTNYIIN